MPVLLRSQADYDIQLNRRDDIILRSLRLRRI